MNAKNVKKLLAAGLIILPLAGAGTPAEASFEVGNLQPMPAGVSPNISGNINSHLDAAPSGARAATASEETAQSNQPDGPATKKSYAPRVVGAIAIIVIASALLIFLRLD